MKTPSSPHFRSVQVCYYSCEMNLCVHVMFLLLKMMLSLFHFGPNKAMQFHTFKMMLTLLLLGPNKITQALQLGVCANHLCLVASSATCAFSPSKHNQDIVKHCLS